MDKTNARKLVITIDGPAGAGKSTVARIAADKLGLPYLDTGAIYRAVTWRLIQDGTAPDETEKITAALQNISVSLSGGRVLVNGRDVTAEIRRPAIDAAVSSFSALRPVRDALIGFQRGQASEGLVADGRDMGTVVFPDADLKIFLTADAEERARRRYKERVERGENADFDEILKYVNERDLYDMNREIAPLRPAPGCVILDSTKMTIEEVTDVIVSLARELGAGKEI
ncbi:MULTISPECIES: (d)CMP kinase [Synergistaceae]|jgi:CMP/dCMP kinase|uniref:(d)CMP kinase n=1 Tax=Synergistaceae TaxID=649777 RepID=UPI003AD8E58B|nr:(d)CMP kinase [Synergistaceae bacterium DZ-S4]